MSSGDGPEGFREFVDGRFPALVRFGAVLSGEATLGEDLAQEALVKTLRAWPKLHPDGEPEAYTRRVMTRAAWRGGRRRWRGEKPTADMADLAVLDPHEALASGVDVLAALRALPADQRIVLVLRYWADRTEDQIATELGIARGTVKSRASRAIATLRSAQLLTDPTAGGAS